MSRSLTSLLIMILMLPGVAGRAKITAVEAGAGLPDKYITSISKDARGLMWIATRQGLCTFDGVRFEPFHAVQSSGLPGSGLPPGTAVTKLLYQPQTDCLWAATERGVYAVRCSGLKTAPAVAEKGWSAGPVADICALPDGRLCASYKSGEVALIAEAARRPQLITRLRQAGGRLSYASSIEPVGETMITLQVSGEEAPWLLSLSSGRLERDGADRAGSLAFFRKNLGDTLLIGRAAGGLEIRSRKTFTPLFPADSVLLSGLRDITDVRFTSPTTLYVLSKQANLFYLDLATHRIDTLASDVFTGKLATCFHLDADGIVWLGTNKGLVKATADNRLFTSALVQSPPISIRSLATDEAGNTYAGTYSGLFRYSVREKGWRKHSRHIPYAMLDMPGRYLYFVGEQPDLFRVDKETMLVETGFYQRKALPPDGLRAAYSLVSDARGTIWIGTSYGLATYDVRTATLSAYRPAGLPANTAVSNLGLTRAGNLWLSTRSGVYEVVPGKGVVWHVGTDTKPALSVATVNYVDHDAAGRLWVCTDGGGINVVSADRKKVTVLKTESGLSDNTTYQLLWQNAERVWISTFNGLSAYNLRTGTFYNFYAEDGLTTNEFNHNAFLKEPSGRMHFGGIGGINSFFPDSIFSESRVTRLLVSGISKWDEERGAFAYLPPADTASSITLRPLDHSLTFYLALTDYHAPENNIFRYRIRGLFDEWVSLGSQRTLRLDGLAAGAYVLEIRATDSRGTPAVNVLRYRIRVGQSFFKSGWFYLLLFVAASVLLSAYFMLRLQHLRRVQRLREQIASDLHDEVGSLLTRITMTSDNLQYGRNTEVEKTGKLQKIAALSRTAVSAMSDVLWAIDARNDYTGNLADRMREHAEEMFAPLDIHPEFDFAVSQRMSISSGLRQQLYLIYKEAINNIVKHSRASAVRIRYHHNEGGFRLSIVNDGWAEKEKASTRGQGLRNMRMRAEKVGARAVAEGKEGLFEVVVSGR